MIQPPLFQLFVPLQAVGANLVYFDLFNATGSASELLLYSVEPVVSGATAVTGVVSVDLFLTRTTAVGTGGTAATFNGTSLTACTITPRDNTGALHPAITARLTPSGGATAGAVISWTSVFTEETSAATYVPALDLARSDPSLPAILIPENSGIRVVQGSVASVGNIGFNVVFRRRRKDEV
jgi:hypothetical protein